MVLRTPENNLLEYDILQVFPFTSETKRMGIIIRVRIVILKISFISSQIIRDKTNLISWLKPFEIHLFLNSHRINNQMR